MPFEASLSGRAACPLYLNEPSSVAASETSTGSTRLDCIEHDGNFKPVTQSHSQSPSKARLHGCGRGFHPAHKEFTLTLSPALNDTGLCIHLITSLHKGVKESVTLQCSTKYTILNSRHCIKTYQTSADGKTKVPPWCLL